MTRTMRAAVAAIVLVAIPVAGLATNPKKRAEVRTYAAPAPFIEPACYLTPAVQTVLTNAIGEAPDDEAVQNVGGACIRVGVNDVSVTVGLEDSAGWRVSGTAFFRDREGAYIEDAQYGFCGSRSIDIPPNAGTLIVTAEATNVWCLMRETATDSGPATTGTINAVFVRVS